MSTILKALRRLEDDQPEPGNTATSGLPATDPAAADELRTRILTEELAAQAATEPEGDLETGSGTSGIGALMARRNVLVAAAVVSILLFLGFGLATFSGRQAGNEPRPMSATDVIAQTQAPALPASPAAAPRREPVLPAAPENHAARVATQRLAPQPGIPPRAPAIRARAAGPEQNGFAAVPPVQPAPQTSRPSGKARPVKELPVAAARPREPQPIPQPVATTPAIQNTPPKTSPTPLALVAPRPKPAAAPRPTPRPSPRAQSRPRPAASEVAPDVVSSAAPTRRPAAEAASTRPERRPSEAVSPKPAPTLEAIARLPRPDIPAVNIERTSWHPQADRRSARIRLEGSDEAMSLREGDAVGALVVKEITPSSVLFETGGIEIRRRVGGSASR